MAELRELFEMTTKQMEPDQDSWRKQEERHQRDARRKKIGALGVAATIAVVAAVGIVWNLDGDDVGEETTPATIGTDTTDLGSGSYHVDLASGRVTVIEKSGLTGDLDVSPDGTSVASGQQKIVVTDLDGTNVQKFDVSEDPGGQRWSPDGKTIVYQVAGRNEAIGNLFALDVASGDVTQLTDLKQTSSGIYYMSPSYSPDGGTILFTMPRTCGSCTSSTGNEEEQVWDLWSIPSSGGEPTIVLRDAGFDEYSPDGSTIAYTRISGSGERGGLWIANADGSDRRQLLAGQLLFPRWSPDGTRIAYADEGDNRTYVFDVAIGVTTSIAGVASWPEWVDDDTLLLG